MMKCAIVHTALAGGLLLMSSRSFSQLLENRPALNREAVRVIAAAAEEYASRNGWKVVLAITDEVGIPVYLLRMDGVQPASVQLAMMKAKCAALYRRPSRLFEERLKGGDQGVLQMPDVFPSAGGVPIVVNGVVTGAVGASGAASLDDERIAQAGVEALMKALEAQRAR